MASSGATKAVKILQLVVSFIAVLLAAFCAAAFSPVFGYSCVWWSFWWTLTISILRWWSKEVVDSKKNRIALLFFELLAWISWLVAIIVLIATNIHLHNLQKSYARLVHSGVSDTTGLVKYQFNAFGLAGLYCSYALNAVTGVVLVLMSFTTLSTFQAYRTGDKMASYSRKELAENYPYNPVAMHERSASQTMTTRTV